MSPACAFPLPTHATTLPLPLPLRHQQLRALFEVYDADRDGRISRGEMLAHVTAVLTLAAAGRSPMAQTAMSPAALAKATVDTCFAGADAVCCGSVCGSVCAHGGPCLLADALDAAGQ